MMQKIRKLLWCLLLCLGIGISSAMADSGVTILGAPKRVDLYRAYENTFYSGSIRYRLDEDAVVMNHSITQYRDLLGFDMNVVDEGNRVYRVDLQGFYTRLTMETFGLPDVMDFTFVVETKTGSQSVTFPVHLHEEVWDARRVDISSYEGGDVKVGDQIVISKPTLDGITVRTGLLNNRTEEHAHHHPDPFFGNGWVNDFSYSTDVLRLVDETGDAFILEAIASGSAETICTVREINSNASLSVINADFMVRPKDPGQANISFSTGSRYKVRFPLQAGSFESEQMLILIEDPSSDSDTLDAKFEYEAYIRDTDVVSEVEFLEARASNGRKAIVFRYQLRDAHQAGVRPGNDGGFSQPVHDQLGHERGDE